MRAGARGSQAQLRDGVLEVFGGDGARALCGGGGEGVVGGTVDEPGQPARAVEQRLDGGGVEQGELAAGQMQAVGLPRFGGRLRAVTTGTGVNDSRWHEVSLGDRC